MSLITLTTDFGESSPYVAVMKGVILSINPAARILDLSHAIPPQDVRHGNYFLTTAVPYFPERAIHVAVIDPGVGTDRAVLLAEVAGQFVLAPDNGALTGLLDRYREARVWRLTERHFWRPAVSSTFHGRDIFAPAAAHLAFDPDPSRFGARTDTWRRLPGEACRREGDRLIGCVQFVDHFGNLISNVPDDALPGTPSRVVVAGRDLDGFRWVRTYGEASPGDLVGLVSSDGFAEVAVVNGSAAGRLGVRAGAAVEIVL